MTFAALVSLLIGTAQLAFSLVVLRRLGRYGRGYPWLAALTVFFALRGVMRIYAGVTGDVPEALALPVDVLLLAVMLLLIAGVERTARALTLAQEEADFAGEEYARALTDYRRLARHRLANPLAAIRGGLATLRSLPLSARERTEIFDAMDAEIRRLERVALDPEPSTPEERTLDPRPHLRPTGSNR